MAPDVSRRRLLIGAGVLSAATLTGVVVVPQLLDDGDDDAADEGGSPTTRETPESPTEAIALVGAAYLASAPDEENDEEHLRSLLPSLTATSANDLVDQLGTLRAPVQADFAEDRTASVDGWILAVTEARAAALVHLAA
jgi:hypothetical protein